MALQDDLDASKAALASIDADSDKLAAGVTAVQTKINGLLAKIPSAATLQEASDIAAQAQAEVGKLGPVADALAAMGTVEGA